MEHSEEIDLAATVSNAEEPQLGSEVQQSSPVDHHSPPSDLNQTVQKNDDELAVELHEKLDLKVEDEGVVETDDKVSNFNDGGVVSDERGSETEDKVLNFDDDERVGDERGAEIEDKVSNFDDGERVGDEESLKGEKVDEEESVKGENEEFVEGEERVDVDGDSKGWDTNSWNENVNEELGGGRDADDWGYGVGNGGGAGYGYGAGYGDGYGDGYGYGDEKEEKSSDGTHQFPLRPEAEDCSFYMKTGSCKFGFNCKFNHPIRRKNQNQAVREKVREREEPEENAGQTECKYYQRSGGCKFGKACKYNHSRGFTAPISELNFLGLPIRLGERECPYYMRTGSCKFGSNCRFNHPDPTTVGGSDPQSGYGNGGSVSLRGVSQQPVASWSSRKLNETPFAPLMPTPTQGLAPQTSDWNGYQAPAYLSERIMHPSSTYVMNNPTIDTNVYMHHQKQMPFEVFPERPGEPECSFFIKTGDCKFKSNCKFHHPKNRVAKLPPCNLSDKGLPLRPDQSVCSHYSRYGICKFGPACRFDHPESALPLMMPGLGQQSFANSANAQVAGMGGSASDATIQQSV
ncbi:putative transcription factor C3H family [Medicago truncatula]|nr:zinc finger CCCH domain-containing protein 67 [Medicago truncatula]AES91101.1 zinc finger C-x8-C-x5-C-x3-H type family protein [Medicago truncatula]RHN63413.1 putative transcription factor C3H family [Medicago truncatula]